MPTPSQQEINQAKALLKKRVEIQTQAEQQLKAEIREAFSEIVALGYAEDIAPLQFRFSSMHNYDELKELLANLRALIYVLMEHSSQDAVQIVEDGYGMPLTFDIGEYMNSVIDDKTLKERINTYTHRLSMEFETWIAAGLIMGLTQKALNATFDMYSNKPYTNALFTRTRNAITPSNAAASRLRTGGVTYGVGQYVSGENSITRLTSHTIADIYREAQRHAFGAINGVIGYYVGRGSSYPCSLCDSYCGFTPVAYAELPPYHARCCCWAVPITIT